MGSSAQISSGVCRCGFWRKVPEGSGRFRRVPACAGVGSGGRFQKVPGSCDVCWCRFRSKVPESSCACAGVGSGGKFRKVPESSGVCWWCVLVVCAGVGSGEKFRKVRESSGVCWWRKAAKTSGVWSCGRVFQRKKFRKVLESSGMCWCRFRRKIQRPPPSTRSWASAPSSDAASPRHLFPARYIGPHCPAPELAFLVGRENRKCYYAPCSSTKSPLAALPPAKSPKIPMPGWVFELIIIIKCKTGFRPTNS